MNNWMRRLEQMGLMQTSDITPEKEIIAPPPRVLPDNSFVPTKNEWTDHFNSLLEKSNFPGADYYEFSKALRSFDDKPLTEKEKYENVYAILQAVGLSVDTVEATANKYINVIEVEEKEFLDDYNSQYNAAVTEQQIKAQELKDENVKLHQQILDNQNKITELSITTDKAYQTLVSSRTAFERTAANLKTSIREHVSNLKLFINGEGNIL